MKVIKLFSGESALVDDEDFDWLDKLSWHRNTNDTSRTVYAMHSYRLPETGRQLYILPMQNAIFDHHKLSYDLVDHIDGSGLNNQKSNLRSATHMQNMWNQKLAKNNTSGYKGVNLRRVGKYSYWRAVIDYHGKKIELGNFALKESAIKIRLMAEKQFYGEFARPLQEIP